MCERTYRYNKIVMVCVHRESSSYIFAIYLISSTKCVRKFRITCGEHGEESSFERVMRVVEL